MTDMLRQRLTRRAEFEENDPQARLDAAFNAAQHALDDMAELVNEAREYLNSAATAEQVRAGYKAVHRFAHVGASVDLMLEDLVKRVDMVD